MSRRTVSSMCQRCQTRFLSRTTVSTPTRSRHISTTSSSQAKDDSSIFQKALRGTTSASTTNTSSSSPSSSPSSFSTPRTPRRSSNLEDLAQGARAEATTRPGSGASEDEPYHINIYSHKHNTHITFTEPSRSPIISYSTGNLGLKKAQRGTFDAAYQLSTYSMRKMAEKQWRIGGKAMTMNKMMTLNEQEVRDRGIELVFRGYGPGREAFQKALLGNEGKLVKPLVKRVVDGTRLKFGGTRSPAIRRL